MKTRTGDPWIPAAEYGALLPQVMVNLIVRDIAASLEFYRRVLRADVHYFDQDFAALRVLDAELMLHADHAYEGSPWRAGLESGQPRGLGAELRLLGMNRDEVAGRARSANALFNDVLARTREVMVQDPDDYVWAIGEIHRANRQSS